MKLKLLLVGFIMSSSCMERIDEVIDETFNKLNSSNLDSSPDILLLEKAASYLPSFDASEFNKFNQFVVCNDFTFIICILNIYPQGKQLNRLTNHLLRCAVFCSKYDIVEFLILRGADIQHKHQFLTPGTNIFIIR